MATIHLPWPNGSLVEIDGSGLGKIKSSDMPTGDFLYDAEVEGSEGFRVKLIEHRVTLLPKNAKPTTRFHYISESEIVNFVHNQTNKNTPSKSTYDLKLLR